MDYDIIVVGSGFCGSTIAALAAQEGKKVLLLEKRNVISGNMYDVKDERGEIVQLYGPHVFHTNNQKVYEFVTSVGSWHDITIYYGVDIDGETLSAPFGFHTIDKFYPAEVAERIKKKLPAAYPGRDSAPVMELLESNDPDIADFAKKLYEKNYKPYALKQWQLKPEDLDPSVIGRLPVIFSDRQTYFTDKYACLPDEGFTEYFEELLDNENIHVKVNCDADEYFDFDFETGRVTKDGETIAIPIVYSGPIDYLVHRKNILPYRTLYFEYKKYDQTFYQDKTVKTYPQRYDYLRTTEFNYFMKEPIKDYTVVAYEYPKEYDPENPELEPYYPILTEKNMELYNSIKKETGNIPNLFLCGRLADYKYYNMDQAVERAFEVYDEVKKQYA